MTLSLPKTLTAEEWDRNKGTIAKKTGGTTGLTEALKELQQAWARSDWEIAQSRDRQKIPAGVAHGLELVRARMCVSGNVADVIEPVNLKG